MGTEGPVVEVYRAGTGERILHLGQVESGRAAAQEAVTEVLEVAVEVIARMVEVEVGTVEGREATQDDLGLEGAVALI